VPLAANLDLNALESSFAANYLVCIAKGANGPGVRFFLYAYETASAAWILVELQLNTQTQTANAILKSGNANVLTQFKPYFAAVLKLLFY